MMSSASRITIVALIACVGTAWTCPTYCAAMSMDAHHPRDSHHPHDVDAAAPAQMAGHEHHHMSSPVNDDSTNRGDAKFQSARGGCCANCGTSEQALLSAAYPKSSGLKGGVVAVAKPASAETHSALLRGPTSPPRHLPHHGPPSLES